MRQNFSMWHMKSVQSPCMWEGMARGGGKVHAMLHKCACLWRTIGFSWHISELFLTFCIVVSYYWLHLQNKITTRVVNCKAFA